jgi:hypothetical protein
MHNLDYARCNSCKGKGGANAPKSAWLLDSGANKHFTFSQDEFIEYNAWPPSKYERLETANSSTKVVGDGTIAINVPNSDGSFRVVTIPGVRHVPDCYDCTTMMS